MNAISELTKFLLFFVGEDMMEIDVPEIDALFERSSTAEQSPHPDPSRVSPSRPHFSLRLSPPSSTLLPFPLSV